jgi:hypothetical protein
MILVFRARELIVNTVRELFHNTKFMVISMFIYYIDYIYGYLT